ncbi:MAG: thiamine diphosphokinase [Paracoccaceae bacterium]|nr:thiamine diphosphokinase [Paracoccaceae bacterium]
MSKKLNLRYQSVTIIGGAGFLLMDLEDCLTHGSTLISADGGANNLDKTKYKLDYIIGDFDSLSNENLRKNGEVKLIEIKEQETTDFEKCLYSVDAATYFCIGFIGRRSDHFLSVCSTLVKYHYKRVILVGAYDIIFHLPKTFEIELPLGTRLSLFPMRHIIGVSDSGLQWSIAGLEFEPSKRIGTSNATVKKMVKITLSNNGMLCIIPRSCFKHVIEAFRN